MRPYQEQYNDRRQLYKNSLFNPHIYFEWRLSFHFYQPTNKCSFDVNSHAIIIDKIRTIEEGILRKINIKNKIPQCKIFEQVRNGNIKIFSDNIEKNNNTFLLKIAGIWETECNYGLTYKFIKA